MFAKVLVNASLAGVAGTALGGVIGVFFGKNTRTLTSRMFNFSCGIMLSIVFFDLLPEALELASIWVICLGIALGSAFVFGISERVERLAHRAKRPESNAAMLTTAIILLLSVVLHNLPEGLVIGSTTLISHGLLTSLLIGVHNVPEGIAMALPFVEGGEGRVKAVLFCALAGFPTVIGAAIGYLMGNLFAPLVAFFMALAAGAMLCAIFSEMIPRAHEISGEGDQVGVAVLIAGAALGLVLVNALG